MKNVLIIKLGAKGDVLRSTVILRALEGRIYWLTSEGALPLLEGNGFIYKIVTDISELKDVHFDLVLNMEDNIEGCKILDDLDYDWLEGFYLKSGRVVATESAKEWWAMSLNGGPDRDELKKLNEKPMQYFFMKLIGKDFNGEEYVLPEEGMVVDDKIVGLEPNVGPVWPMKRWHKYDELKRVLESRGYRVVVFSHKNSLKEYIRDINKCSIVVCGDSLPMHIALALKKKVIALFGPTSANEIYDYGRLKKIVAPVECVCCYKRKCDKKPNCMDLITVDKVAKAVEEVRKWPVK